MIPARPPIVGNYRMVYQVQKTVVILTIFEGHHVLPDLDADE